ncbi:MAG: transcription antitermination protein NusB [Acidimicrobiaceae bacterium]|nr:transcription antitermination protein NusB [Acidimicrobiaceae bacterium]
MEEDRRSEARERALDLLYEADAKELSVGDVLAALPVRPDDLAVLLVEGVAARRGEIDGLLAEHARGWTLERMPVIDRTVLQVAVFELMARPDVPTAVVIDEAVELAKRFSTDDSGRFVNGMLATIAPLVRPPT